MHGAGVFEYTLEYKPVILCLIYNIKITFFLYPVVAMIQYDIGTNTTTNQDGHCWIQLPGHTL